MERRDKKINYVDFSEQSRCEIRQEEACKSLAFINSEGVVLCNNLQRASFTFMSYLPIRLAGLLKK
jgi:hypothetical protein